MQTAIHKCTCCKKLTISKQKECFQCRKKRAAYRLNNIETERTYQARRWAERMCVHSRLSDKRANRPYKQQEYITPSRLHFLRKHQYNKCVYCKCEMITRNRKLKNGLTIERLHNETPHIIQNCVLACARCNTITAHTRIPIIQHCFRDVRDTRTNCVCRL